MKLKVPVLFVIILLTVVACKKHDDTSNKIYLLNQVVQTTGSSSVVTTLKYDDQNHLLEYYDDSANKNDCKFSYDSNDRLTAQNVSAINPVSANNPVAGTSASDYTYTYPSATTVNGVVVNKFNGATTSTNTQVFTLNDKQQVTKLDYGTTSPTISIYTYDSAGNRLTQSDYSNGAATPGYVFAFTYDQNKSYFANVKGNVLALALNPGINNPVKETYTSITPNITITTTYTSTFEYNSDGYPTKETRVQTRSNSNVTSTQTFTYSYIVK